MGRVKKYHNEDEKKLAKKNQWLTYYERNKIIINAKRMKKYYEKAGKTKNGKI